MSRRISWFFVLFVAVVVSSSLLFYQKSQVVTFSVEDDVQVIDDNASSDLPAKSKGLNSQKKNRVRGYIGKEHPDLFAEWHNGIRTRPGAEAPDYPYNYQIKEYLKARNVSSSKDLSFLRKGGVPLDWVERGPGNVAGRTRSILVDPRDPNYDTWIVGSVSGGAWKTEDAGQSWTHLTAALPNLATSTLAWSPNFPDTIYLGTGEGFLNVDEVDGSGIWKSTDGGTSWDQLLSTLDMPDFENVMRIIVDPDDPDVVLAAVRPGVYSTGLTTGIYRSTDGGTTWTKTYTGVTAMEHLVANPLNFNTQFATDNSTTVIKSVDGGQTWIDSGEGITTGLGVVPPLRMELAVTDIDTNIVYIAGQLGVTGASTLYRSEDGGATWFAHLDEAGVNPDWLAGQGWYDNTIAVHPYDPNVVVVGGVDLFELDAMAGSDTSATGSVDFENTQSFLSPVNWGGSFSGSFGSIDIGVNFHLIPTGNTLDEYANVEVRFGPGKRQKAHRFLFASGFQYPYQDYVDVPFEVWDIDNNRQLMLSFRDQEDNGVWELEDRDTNESSIQDREYTFVHSLDYDPDTPDANIATTAGQAFKNIYAIWVEAPAGAGVVDSTTLDTLAMDATLRINSGIFVTKRLAATVIADGRGRFGGTTRGVHVDHHNLTFIRTDEPNEEFRLINGNDGGISYTDDLETFVQTGDTFGMGLRGYNTTQFYGVDKAPGIDRYIGGMQDNGSWVSPLDADETSVWTPAPSGDGFETVWNHGNVDWLLESSQFNNIFRSTDQGLTWFPVGRVNGLADQGGNSPFFTKIAKSKQDADLVFAVGASGVWRSDNFASVWTLTPMPSGFNGANSFSQIKISLVDPQIVWSARNMTGISPPFVSTDGGLTFAATDTFDVVRMARISGLETHPIDENTAFILSSIRGLPKVLRTQDLGQTWEDLSGFGANSTSANGFPDVAVYSLLVMPFDTDMIWAGTEIGLFESTDGGASWAFTDNGLEAVAIYEMLIVNDEVVVATHGRGVWTVALPELAGYEPPSATLSPRFAFIGGGGGGMIEATLRLPSDFDSTFVTLDGERVVSLGTTSAGLDTAVTLVAAVSQLDTAEVSVSSYASGRRFSSATVPIEVFPLNDAQASFADDFNEDRSNFVFKGMSLQTDVAGFDDGALHSLHPYNPNSDATALLTTPIEVAGSNATVAYDDVAIVEAGAGSGVFGDPLFFDFVIVEGSNDNGVSWMPLADGYDSRSDSTWLATDLAGGAGDAIMFVHHELNLLDTFSAGEFVLIRFRLSSDPGAESWGWAIDNLNIQDGLVSVADDNSLIPDAFNLSQNYPNPFNPTTQIDYALPKQSEVTLAVFNLLGQLVRTLLDNENREAGFHSIQWDGKDHLGRQVSSGLYIYRIQADAFVKSFKMMLLK